jgi:hypothetical protein
MTNSLPDYIRLRLQRALLGEIYAELRAIAVEFEEKKKLRLRYYLDREPTEFDRESISMLMTEMLAATSSSGEAAECIEECVRDLRPFGQLDALNGLVYARREYDIPPLKKPPSAVSGERG